MKINKIAFTTITAAVLLTGCGSDYTSGNNAKLSENDSEINDSIIESAFSENSILSQPEISQPTDARLEVSDEIKKAALNSGLVQLNNDVFQRGGYITVADFVKKYQNRYNVTFSYYQNFIRNGAYEDCRDYLIEYDYRGSIFTGISRLGARWWEGYELFEDNAWNNYYLTLTPKDGYNAVPVKAYVVNAVSPDAEITLDNAIIAEVEPICYDDLFTTPEWLPMGVNNEEFKDFESENQKYSAKDIANTLEANGLEKNSAFEHYAYVCPAGWDSKNYNTYWKSGNDYGCYILGKENLFGASPLYYYRFTINPDTDILDYAKCTLEFFVEV